MTNIKFKDYELGEDILKSLDMLGYHTPTQVQQDVIPTLLDRKDLIIQSETGSGKTAAFAIPVCEMLEWNMRDPQTLVLTPTRELALQIKEDIFNIGRFKRLKVEAIFGKTSFEGQRKQLRQRCHVVVATPGRLIDHIEQGTIILDEIKTVVIDEADEMLNMGFIDQIETILGELSPKLHMILLSATMPDHIEELCKKYMRDPKRVIVESKNVVTDRIQQVRYDATEETKRTLLYDVLVNEQPESCIIFGNTRNTVEGVVDYLQRKRIPARALHGGMEQKDRTKTIADFKHGMFRYLIATDVAARGLDIEDIELVINYDLPRDPAVYKHRIGRTARHEKLGKAVSLVSVQDEDMLEDILEYTASPIELVQLPHKEEIKSKMTSFRKLVESKPTIRKNKGLDFNNEITKLHINCGKKQKMRPADVVGTLCNLEGMSVDDIGVISIIDLSTFVEILNNKGELVFKALQTVPLKGRLRKVSYANTSEYEELYYKQEKKNRR